MKKILFFLMSVLISLTSCEKMDFSESKDSGSSKDKNYAYTANVSILKIEQEDFNGVVSRAGESFPVDRISFAVFDSSGDKIYSKNQTSSDSGFGSANIGVNKGNYTLVIIAHNGTGNCTISTPEKVTFSSNKVTDTFISYSTFTIEDKNIDIPVSLNRAVSKIKVIDTSENKPSNLSQFKFYYTGGSSTLNPKTGFGCVNSKQTEYREKNDSGIYEIYSFPHENDDLIKLTITALNSSGTSIKEKVISDIPITKNKITNLTGSIFSEGDVSPSGGGSGNDSGSSSISITINSQWGGENNLTY